MGAFAKEYSVFTIDYLVNAHIDPEQFANFLYRLGGKSDGMDKYLAWVSTHPNSRERAEYIVTYSLTKKKQVYEPILSDESWVELQLALGY